MTNAEALVPALEGIGLGKTFGATAAVHDVSLQLWPARVHGLVGANGAGKSTLIKMLVGDLQPDTGEIRRDGHARRYAEPAAAIRDGIAFISQEGSLVPTLTAAQNILLGTEPNRLGVLRRDRELERRRDEAAAELGFDIDFGEQVRRLSPAQRKQVEIVRALTRQAGVIIFDEPTAALGQRDSEALLASIRSLAERGVAIAFVSHFLDEVLGICDEVVVMRNGEVVSSGPSSQESQHTLVQKMLGDVDLVTTRQSDAPPKSAPVLSVEGISVPGIIESASFTVRLGEIVGLAGVVGSGRSELVHAVFGSGPRSGGSVRMDGKPVAANVQAAVAAGMALVPEDRKLQGLVLRRPAGENISLAEITRRFPGLRPIGAAIRRDEVDGVRRAGVNPPDPRRDAGRFSGGNQQKILIGKWLMTKPRMLIVDEPTRGIDVGSKAEVHRTLIELSQEGMAILLISSEFDEIAALAHRTLVLRDGVIADELPGGATEEEIMTAAFVQEPAMTGEV